MPLVNTAQEIKRCQIDPSQKYLAIVIGNDAAESVQVGRIKFRIPQVLDFSLALSPWAIGGSNDGRGLSYGTFDVPPVGAQVLISFQQGSNYHPMYERVPILTPNMMVAALVNYPYRKIFAWENVANPELPGAFIIIDTYSGDMILSNPVDGAPDATITINNAGIIALNGSEIDLNAFVKTSNGMSVGNGGTGSFSTQDGQTISYAGGIILGVPDGD